MNQPAPSISNIVIIPKTDGSPRMTLDSHSVSKLISYCALGKCGDNDSNTR